jgi:UDP-N-acetylmuramate dehydrogenase
MLLYQNYSLKLLNTFRVDVKARFFAEIFSEDELIELLTDNKIKKEEKFVLGSGSNVLFTKDFDGLIIKVSIAGINIVDEKADSVIIEAGAGVIWNDLVSFCVEKNFGGIENLTLIPGTVGAAPIQNIGAYGKELADTFESLSGVCTESGERKNFNKMDCHFSYRSSIFKNELRNEFVITSIRLKLSKSPQINIDYKILKDYLKSKNISNPAVKDVSYMVAEIRKNRLPDPLLIGNAGSFFKNPVIDQNKFNALKSDYPEIVSFPAEKDSVKISAGWLLENCGWKGKRIKDVGTFPRHALVVCNFGNANGDEIFEFTKRMKEDVANKFGIKLEEEVNIL